MIATAEMLRAARQIERTYCKKLRKDLYIACEEYDFTWSTAEITSFRKMWREGKPINRIAKTLRRHINEVFILALDQAEQGLIGKRPGGIFGTREGKEDE